MPGRRYRPDEIINKLREAEWLLSHGCAVGSTCLKIGVSQQTYYRWRRQYGGVRVEQARRLSELEKENGRLKKLLRELSLDGAVLKEEANGELPSSPKRPHLSVTNFVILAGEKEGAGTGPGNVRAAMPP